MKTKDSGDETLLKSAIHNHCNALTCIMHKKLKVMFIKIFLLNSIEWYKKSSLIFFFLLFFTRYRLVLYITSECWHKKRLATVRNYELECIHELNKGRWKWRRKKDLDGRSEFSSIVTLLANKRRLCIVKKDVKVCNYNYDDDDDDD